MTGNNQTMMEMSTVRPSSQSAVVSVTHLTGSKRAILWVPLPERGLIRHATHRMQFAFPSMLWPIVLACKMTQFEILNVFLFIGVFPALWILAAVLDRFLPTDSRLHSPREERKRQLERDQL